MMTTAWKRELAARTVEDWEAALSRIGDAHLRGRVASRVWWDFLSQRRGGGGVLVRERWAVMMECGAPMGLTTERIVAGLQLVGYSEREAALRGRVQREVAYQRHNMGRHKWTSGTRESRRKRQQAALEGEWGAKSRTWTAQEAATFEDDFNGIYVEFMGDVMRRYNDALTGKGCAA